MPTPKIKLIIWDWAGTLVELKNQAPLVFYSAQASARNKESEENFSDTYGSEYINEIKRNLYAHGAWFIPYAWNLVEQFNKDGYMQAIVTNAESNEIIEALQYAPFSTFDMITGIDSSLRQADNSSLARAQLGSLRHRAASADRQARNCKLEPDLKAQSRSLLPKPAPDMLEHTLEVLKVKKDEAIFIGDSESDKIAAEAAQIKFYLVDYTIKPYYDLTRYARNNI